MDWYLSESQRQFARYLVNGVAATLVHYGVLALLIEVAHFPSAGVASFLAAIVGITASFVGSRYYVFRAKQGDWRSQAQRFAVVYAILAIVHATVLFVWTDQLGLDFRIGFVLATGLQMMISFFANKLLVFSP